MWDTFKIEAISRSLMLASWVSRNFTIFTFVFEFKSQYTGARFHDQENNTKVKSFFVLGMDISKKFNPTLTYFMSFDNLLNKKFQVIRSYPMPGFSVTSGLKFEF